MTPKFLQHMEPGEFQMVREYLGLDTRQAGQLLGTRPDTVRKWEQNKKPIPIRVPADLQQLETDTAKAVDHLIATLNDQPDPTVYVYRQDHEFHADHPLYAHLPADWWRMVVARACQEVPGVKVMNRT